MQSQRSAIDVAVCATASSARKPRSGPAWLALTLGVALLPHAGRAQTVEWAASAGGIEPDYGIGIAVDAAGNSYVTGSFGSYSGGGTATFGPFTLTSAGSRDIFVAKYDAAGNVLWARSAGGTGNDVPKGIAVDIGGNSYITGPFETATFGPFTLISGGVRDIFVAKYDTDGNVLWARSAGGTGDDSPEGIAVDAAGNSYVTGYYDTMATFGSFTLTSVLFSTDIFVAKYDTTGSVLWARSAGGTSFEAGRGIAVDSVGNSYLTGSYSGTATFGPFTLTSAGFQDIFVAKYDAGGNVVWARSAGGSSSTGGGRETADRGLGIAVDTAGNSYVTGYYDTTAAFGSFTLTGAGDVDIFVAKYDPAGSVVWARSAGGTSGDIGRGIAVDTAGNSYVVCDFAGTVTFSSFTLTSAGDADIFVAKYDAAGSVLWARSAGGTSHDQGRGIAVDTAGNSYVTGHYDTTANFCPFMLTSAGSVDIFVAKYVLFPDCGNGSIDPCEECDAGVGCTDCLCVTDFEPTAPPSLDCQPKCGNGSIDPGEECDGTNDALCPGNCLADCTCEPGTEIPAVSEWGLIILATLLTCAGTILFRSRRASGVTPV